MLINKFQKVLLPAFILIFLIPAGIWSQNPSYEKINAANGEKIRRLMSGNSVPGIGVAVVIDGKTVWNESFGLANIEANTPVTAETKFGIGSISKSLTMTLAARLVDEGLLDLDAPIENYLPDFPHKTGQITVRLIAAHLSGYSDDFDNAHYTNSTRYKNAEQVLKEFYKEPLAFKPHEKSVYGTTTYTLIAAVIEKAAKRDFVTAMNDFVLKPLRLKNIMPNDRQAIIANRTGFYVKDETGKPVNGQFVDPSFKLAGAGFLSTAADLAKFGAALTDSNFIKAKTLDELFRPMETASGEKTVFALGFRVMKLDTGREIIYQPGGGIGIDSLLIIDRKSKISVAVLANQTNAPVGGIAQEIALSYINAN